jgi:hypothetical protein
MFDTLRGDQRFEKLANEILSRALEEKRETALRR